MESEILEQLGRNRRLVVGLSLASGVAGLVPLPLTGGVGIGLVRAFLVGRLARRRALELPRGLTLVLAGGFRQPSLSRLAAIGAVVVGTRLAWRRLSRTLVTLLRFDEVGRTFLLGTYFEYYLLAHRRQQGPMTADEAGRLAEAIRRASASAWGHLVTALFRKTVSDVVRAGTFVPRTLWSLARSAMENGEGDSVEQVVEDDVHGFFGRVTQMLEHELSATGKVTLEALCAAFDAAWTQPPLAATGASR